MTRDEVIRAQRGDHHAFEQVAAAMAGRLVGTATLILRDSDAARDAVQETLIEVWRGLPSLREPDAFEGWTHRILVRACQQVQAFQLRQRQHVARRVRRSRHADGANIRWHGEAREVDVIFEKAIGQVFDDGGLGNQLVLRQPEVGVTDVLRRYR